MTSYMQKKETVERKWYVIDAEGQSLGRVAIYVENTNQLTLHILIVVIIL